MRRSFSTTLDEEVKRAATEYCKRHGLKLHYFIERAIVEQLEDEIDLEAYEARRDEPSIPFAEIRKSRKKRKRSK